MYTNHKLHLRLFHWRSEVEVSRNPTPPRSLHPTAVGFLFLTYFVGISFICRVLTLSC